MLTVQEAEYELEKGAEMNPGLWKMHSISVATNARLIADKVSGMDSDKAYILGLLHDIGRRAGKKAILHIFDGYDYMMSIDQPEIARICLTHSFPVNNSNIYFGKYDCTAAQKSFLDQYIEEADYGDYDKLIQLCDAISLPDGACIMEKRLVDVALRHGLPEFTLIKWKAFMELKKYFDVRCGCNIYSLLPNVLENSYESLI
ncbi:MAG: HD domain-containing protein [Acetatifactor sp.]|nr:HD domain-containing protein [Acetatifactor sp.]